MESDREEHVDCSPRGLTTGEAGGAAREARRDGGMEGGSSQPQLLLRIHFCSKNGSRLVVSHLIIFSCQLSGTLRPINVLRAIFPRLHQTTTLTCT